MLSRSAVRAVASASTRALHADKSSSAVATPLVQQDALQTQILKDTFGRRHNYLRISLTEKCNLRCTYCMPAGGVDLSPRAQLLTSQEVLALARVFASLGVDKIRLTGGEPTLRKDLPELIQELKSIPGIRTVAMTTNGVALLRRLPAYQRAGLDSLNISLDSLKPDRYERMARRPALTKVLAGIDLALQLGYAPLKINTVLIEGVNDDELFDFVEMTRDRDLEVRFIEFMPFSGNEWSSGGMLPSKVLLRRLAAKYDLYPAAPKPNDTARAGVARGGAAGGGGLHRVHDAGLLRDLQPNAPHRRWQSQGVSVRRGRGFAKRRVAGGRHHGTAVRSHTSRAQQQNEATRRYGESRPNGKPSNDPNRWLTARHYSSMTHVDEAGRARMVSVQDKSNTKRQAVAMATLKLSDEALKQLRLNTLKKGDALTVAEIAGVMAAKKTSHLIPLCHPLILDSVRVKLDLPEQGSEVKVQCYVECTGRTGVEMESLVGAAVATLALYDMCKSVDKHMELTSLRVVRKFGGKADFDLVSDSDGNKQKNNGTDSKSQESYTPTSYMH